SARHDVADDYHVGRRVELGGVKPFGDADAERFELSAHRRIDVAIGAGDLEAGGTRDGRDTGHESATDAENVNVHWHFQGLTGGNSAICSSPLASVCRMTSATLEAADHSSAARTMWLLAAISHTSSSSQAHVIGTCQALSSPKRRSSHSHAISSG